MYQDQLRAEPGRLFLTAALRAGHYEPAPGSPVPAGNAWTRLTLVCTGMAVDVVWSSLDEMAG